MNCEKCNGLIPQGEEREYYGRTLCEDCYMDSLSPSRTCDPWDVHSAKSLKEKSGGLILTPTQSKILSVLNDTGGVEPNDLAQRLGLTSIELEREIAALRHMEKVRGELRDGRKYIRLW